MRIHIFIVIVSFIIKQNNIYQVPLAELPPQVNIKKNYLLIKIQKNVLYKSCLHFYTTYFKINYICGQCLVISKLHTILF